MPDADFKCVKCGGVVSLPLPVLSEVVEWWVGPCSPCEGRRVWVPVGIGVVPGAGGSPSR